MAKTQNQEAAPEVDAKPEPAADVLPMPAQSKPQRWQIAPKAGGAEMVVEAYTIEDAIRVYNGQSTSFSCKQLDIKAI